MERAVGAPVKREPIEIKPEPSIVADAETVNME